MSEAECMDVAPLQVSDQNEKDSSVEQTTLEQTLELGCGSVCRKPSEQGFEGVQSEQGEIRSSGSIIVDEGGLRLCSEDVTKNVVAENSGPPAEESKSIQNVKKSLDEPTTLLQGSGEPSDMDVTPLQASDQNEKDSSQEQTTLEQTLDLGCGSVCCEPSEQGHEGVQSEQGEISSGSIIADGEGLRLCSEDVTKNVVSENFVLPAEESTNIQNVKKSFDEPTTLLQGSGEPSERKHQIGSELLPTAPVETSKQSEHNTQVASESELSDSTDDETWTVKETQGNVSSDSSDKEYRTDAIAPTKRKKRTGKVTLALSKGNASILKDEAGRASKKRTRQKPKTKDPNGSPVASDEAGRATTKKRTCQKSKAKDLNGSPATSDKDFGMSRSSGKKVSSSSNRRLGETATQGLYKVFKNNQYPDRAMKEKLAAELGLTLQQVDKWFGNARWSFRHSSCVQPCSTVCPGSHPSRDKTPLTETPKTSTAASECSGCESGK